MYELVKIRLLEVELMLKFCTFDENLSQDLVKNIKKAKETLIAHENSKGLQPREKSILVA